MGHVTDFVRPILTGRISKKEKRVLWFIGKLTTIEHFVIIILKAFAFVLG